MLISKVEDIAPVPVFHYDVLTSIIMPNDWWVANWTAFSFGNWYRCVIYIYIFLHNNHFVEFLSVLPCGQLKLYPLFTECIKNHIISCLSMTVYPNILKILLLFFSVPSHNLLVRRLLSFPFAVTTPFFEILFLNLSIYWQCADNGIIQSFCRKIIFIPSGSLIPWIGARGRTTKMIEKQIFIYTPH